MIIMYVRLMKHCMWQRYDVTGGRGMEDNLGF